MIDDDKTALGHGMYWYWPINQDEIRQWAAKHGIGLIEHERRGGVRFNFVSVEDEVRWSRDFACFARDELQ